MDILPKLARFFSEFYFRHMSVYYVCCAIMDSKIGNIKFLFFPLNDLDILAWSEMKKLKVIWWSQNIFSSQTM